MEFSFSLYDLPSDFLKELSFRISCSSCTAWEIAPLKLMKSDFVTDKMNTPVISINGLSVGQFFERTIKYETLRPQIVAYGLREDSFSWSLQDEALGMGSYVFVAALGVKKGAKEVTIQKSVAIRTKNDWLTETQYATTEILLESIDLAQ